MRLVPALALLLTSAAAAQNGPAVIGVNNFIHATQDWDKSVAFYQEVFGLPKPNPPRPPNPAVPALINAPGAQLKVAVFRLPGAAFGFELTHFGPIETKGGQANFVDPAAAHLRLHVRNVARILAALKKAGAPIVSRGGGPIELSVYKSLLFRDPDGYLVLVREVPVGGDIPAQRELPAGNLVGASMGLTVTNLDHTMKFYGDLLGFRLGTLKEPSPYEKMLDLINAPANATFRRKQGFVPGSKAPIEILEFHHVKGTPFRCRVPDPGCPAVAFRVADLDGLLKRMKAAGVKVVSAGGEPAQFSPTIRNIFVEDPDGFKVELYESAQ